MYFSEFDKLCYYYTIGFVLFIFKQKQAFWDENYNCNSNNKKTDF